MIPVDLKKLKRFPGLILLGVTFWSFLFEKICVGWLKTDNLNFLWVFLREQQAFLHVYDRVVGWCIFKLPKLYKLRVLSLNLLIWPQCPEHNAAIFDNFDAFALKTAADFFVWFIFYFTRLKETVRVRRQLPLLAWSDGAERDASVFIACARILIPSILRDVAVVALGLLQFPILGVGQCRLIWFSSPHYLSQVC